MLPLKESSNFKSYRLERKNIVRHAMREKFLAPTLVIDITYRCNALCGYCRWGDIKTLPQRSHQKQDTIMISKDTLRTLGTRRVVLSGGEPRLHPDINKIIRYYANLVDDVVVITNGYGLDLREVYRLSSAGATGITLSLDSVDPTKSMVVRATTPKQHQDILYNIKEIASATELELGINSTVSHVTAEWDTVRGLLDLGRILDLDFVKFQPIFDDGYASTNAPDLLLGYGDVESLREIASKITDMRIEDYPLTNPPGFWMDIATLAAGEQLPGSTCGLGSSLATYTGNTLGMCYWVKESRYNDVGPQQMRRVQNKLEDIKPKCTVNYHCFCNQRIDHTWT